MVNKKYGKIPKPNTGAKTTKPKKPIKPSLLGKFTKNTKQKNKKVGVKR